MPSSIAKEPAHDCRFCRFGRPPDPTPLIMETDRFLAVFNQDALTRGHAMLIPKAHYQELFELGPEELGELGSGLSQLARKLRRFSPDFTISLNHGRIAGQHVEHLHFHVIPRYATGSGSLASGVAWGYDQPKTRVGIEEMRQLLAVLTTESSG